jgi:hypothetical protein
MMNIGLIGVGPIIGGGVGYALTRNEIAAAAGATAGIAARNITLGTVGKGIVRTGGFIAPRLWSASNFIRFGTATTSIGLGTVIASVAAGAAAGVIVGTGVSYAMFGKDGAEAAVEFYTEPSQWVERLATIGDIPELLREQNEAWQAVPGNAAGISAGTQIDPVTGLPEERQMTGTVLRYYESYQAGQDIRY